MNGRQERERQKAQLLRQIQQQRLELSACRRHWHERLRALDRGWAYAAEFTFVADGWQRSDGRMVRYTTSAFLMRRWTKRGLGLWSTWRPVRGDPAPVGSSLAAPERGRFPRRPRSAISLSVTAHPVRSNMRLFRSAPFSTTPFTSRHTADRWWPIAFGYTFASAY